MLERRGALALRSLQRASVVIRRAVPQARHRGRHCHNDPVDVEALAVSEITQMIARCSHLKPEISLNDKTPFTDGFVHLYTGLGRSKAEWKGRVTVQVKGRTRSPKKLGISKYSVSRTDLLAHQKDSGVLYFVVAVAEKSGKCRAHYALLSPFAIQAILDRAPANATQISVPMKELPSDPNVIERIVDLALKTRDQNPAIGFDPVLFENVERLTLLTTSELDFTAPVSLAAGVHDFALVLTTANGLSIPLGGELRILPPEYTSRIMALRVRGGTTVYESAVVRRTSEESFEAVLSDGLTLAVRHPSGAQVANVSLSLERNLGGRLKSIEFYNSLIETGHIEIGGQDLPLEINQTDRDQWLLDHLKALRALGGLLEVFDADPHLIDLDQVGEEQIKQLNVLRRAVVQNEEISDSTTQESSRVLQQVGQWNLLLMKVRGCSAGWWRYFDPFSASERRQYRWTTEEGDKAEAIPVTAYDIVDDEHIGTTLNLRLDAIVDAYKAIADFPSTFGLANQRVLALITAADAIQERKGELLGAATALNDWLIEEQSDQPHHLINRWQLAARAGKLTEAQRTDIRSLRREVSRNGAQNVDEFQLACALLLQDEDEIADLVREFPRERLEQLQTCPIWSMRGHRA